jgi:hypothetical protein
MIIIHFLRPKCNITKVYAETKDIYAIKDALHHSNIDTSKHYISDKEAGIDAAAEAASTFFK